MKRAGLVSWLSGLLLCGCPSAPSEPPPPPRKPDIAVAPPRALGAMAAGTDAAPRPETVLRGDGEPVAPDPTPPLAAPDAGTPDAGPSPKTAPPDAGMAL